MPVLSFFSAFCAAQGLRRALACSQEPPVAPALKGLISPVQLQAQECHKSLNGAPVSVKGTINSSCVSSLFTIRTQKWLILYVSLPHLDFANKLTFAAHTINSALSWQPLSTRPRCNSVCSLFSFFQVSLKRDAISLELLNLCPKNPLMETCKKHIILFFFSFYFNLYSIYTEKCART